MRWVSDNRREHTSDGRAIGGEAHRLVQADAVAWLEADRGSYDLIFCDPPTFSNSARADDFDVQREHVRLLRAAVARLAQGGAVRSEEHTSELQSLMRISYAVFCLKKQNQPEYCDNYLHTAHHTGITHLHIPPH